VKFFFAHAMPYAALDAKAARTHGTAWLTLPNSLYDPREGQRLFVRYMDEMVRAEALGFDGIAIGEYRQTAAGLTPAPGVVAGAIAQSTRTARIAVLGRALPLAGDPMAIAAEFAVLDALSGGRVIVGISRGRGVDYHAGGISAVESRARFVEAHDLLLRAWTAPGPERFEGRFHASDYVNLWPRPVQAPHPPIWVVSQGAGATVDWAAGAVRRYPLVLSFGPAARLNAVAARYRETALREGYEARSEQIGAVIRIYVAETDAAALAQAAPHIELDMALFQRMSPEMLSPPGFNAPDPRELGLRSYEEITGGARTAAELARTGGFLCGSPDHVAERLDEIRRQAGVGLLIAELQFGTLPADLTRKSMELFASEVIPRFR
jgi:alkanesulfonate monooxygenase SsuD/methylene tetrahydromethanopterin reductase-like flavin-dependent oxidoreductase (luciferase family)